MTVGGNADKSRGITLPPFMKSTLFRPRFLPVLTLLTLAPAFVIEAASWKKEPQPLVAGSLKTGPRYAVTATPGSNLVFDSSWRILWSVDGDSLTGHIWNRAKYFERLVTYAPTAEMFRVGSGSALVLDPAWHVTYFVSPDGRLRAMQKSPSGWVITDTIPGNVTQVLGVHPDWHTVFAYEATTRSLLAVHWSAADNMWKSDVIATDLGDAPAEGVVDAKRHVLYATFQNAPAHGVPAAPGRLQPWPLVAAWWDGTGWKSQVIASTGVAQRPAHVPGEDRLYYTDRADLSGLRSFRPSQGKLIAGERKFIPDLLTKGTHSGSTTPVFRGHAGWQGAPTWVDDQRYAVNLGVQNYFPGSNLGSSVSISNGSLTLVGGTLSVNNSWAIHSVDNALIWLNAVGGNAIPPQPYEAPPHNVVSAHVPVWETPEHAAPGLQQFRALYSEKRGEIVQQRVSEGEWTQTLAHNWQSVDHVYQIPGENRYYRLGPGVVTSRRRHYELTVVQQAATGAIVLAAGNAPVNIQDGSIFQLNGNITGSGGLAKNGAGTLALSGTSTFTGGVSVNAGRLVLTGTTQSLVTVSPGATLSGTGTASGGVVISGTLAPGNSIGTLTTGALTLTSGSVLNFEIGDWNGAAGTGYDTINAASLDLTSTSGSPITINVDGLVPANFDGSSSDFILLSTNNGITGFFQDTFVINSAGAGGWSVLENGNNLVLHYSNDAATSPSNGPPRPENGQGTSNSGTQVVTPSTPNIPTLLPGQAYSWAEIAPGNPPAVTVDGVAYLDPSHSETVTYVPYELRRPLTDLLGKGAVVADPAALPAEAVDLVETGAGIHTFGHRIADANPRPVVPGGRFQSYTVDSMPSAKAGGIARDAASSTVFYVQAPAPGGGPCWIVVVN